MVNVPMVIALVCAFVAFGFFLASRRNRKAVESLADEFAYVRAFTDWAQDTEVVVRDRTNHEDARRVTLAKLYLTFRDGDAYENAMMLFQNPEFKVYVKGPKKG